MLFKGLQQNTFANKFLHHQNQLLFSQLMNHEKNEKYMTAKNPWQGSTVYKRVVV